MKSSVHPLYHRWLAVTIGVVSLGIAGTSQADPVLRWQQDLRGDLKVIGNVSGYDCNTPGNQPDSTTSIIASNACYCKSTDTTCKNARDDSSPDVFWKVDAPMTGQALADATTKAADASSRAILNLPAGATVAYARLYWAASGAKTLTPLDKVTFSRPGGFSQTITADTTRGVVKINDVTASPGMVYQSTADVTALVQANGIGAYQVKGIPSIELPGLDKDVAFVGWNMMVVYNLSTDPVRNIAVFDGLDKVESGKPAHVSITGFLVPPSGFTAKITVVAYEGDQQWKGDALKFNGNLLSNAQNPADNFFNATHSDINSMGVAVPVSTPGDLPLLDGTAGTLVGMDIDTVDVTSYVTAGDKTATFDATSSLDVYMLGVFGTSITTYKPILDGLVKSVTNVTDPNRGVNLPLDTMQYQIGPITNTGNDAGVDMVVTDELPAQVTYVPGTLCVIQTDMTCTPVTDAIDMDVGEYIPGMSSNVIKVRLGQGANGTTGGKIAMGASVPGIRFQVKVNAGVVGHVANQGLVTVTGEKAKAQGSMTPTGYGTGNGVTANTPTVFDVVECNTNQQCPEGAPICINHTCTKTCDDDSSCTGLPGGPHSCQPGPNGNKYCQPLADLALSATATEATDENQVSYVLTPSNVGSTAVPGGKITISIPDGVTVVQGTLDGGPLWTCSEQDAVVVCTSNSTLLPGNNGEIHFTLAATSGGETLTLKAHLDAVGIEDKDLSNNDVLLVTGLNLYHLSGGGFGCHVTTGSNPSFGMALGASLLLLAVWVVFLRNRTQRLQSARR